MQLKNSKLSTIITSMCLKIDQLAFIYLFWANRSIHLHIVSFPKKSYFLPFIYLITFSTSKHTTGPWSTEKENYHLPKRIWTFQYKHVETWYFSQEIPLEITVAVKADPLSVFLFIQCVIFLEN
jgi:hypothetical protein